MVFNQGSGVRDADGVPQQPRLHQSTTLSQNAETALGQMKLQCSRCVCDRVWILIYEYFIYSSNNIRATQAFNQSVILFYILHQAALSHMRFLINVTLDVSQWKILSNKSSVLADLKRNRWTRFHHWKSCQDSWMHQSGEMLKWDVERSKLWELKYLANTSALSSQTRRISSRAFFLWLLSYY